MKKNWLFVGVMTAVFISTTVAHAACSAKITKDTPAREDEETVLKAGTPWGPPSQFVVEPATGNAFLCEHGGYCYASDNIVLSGCKLVPMGLDDNQQADDDILFAVK